MTEKVEMVQTYEKWDRGQSDVDGGGDEGTWQEISWKIKENRERNSAIKLGSVRNRGTISTGLSKM